MVDVRPGKHANHAWQSFGRVGRNAVDLRMRVGTAQERGVEHARQYDIVHIRGDAFDQARVFDALDCAADVAFFHF